MVHFTESAYKTLVGGSVVYLARCLRIELTDGTVMRITEHDTEVTVFEGFVGGAASFTDPQVYSPVDGWDATNSRAEAALKESSMEFNGAFGGDNVSQADILHGKWEDAIVWDFRVDWRVPWLGTPLRSQKLRLGDFKHDDGIWTAQAYNLYADYHVKWGKAYTKTCHHSFGDADCGINVAVGGTTRFTCKVLANNGDPNLNLSFQYDDVAPDTGAISLADERLVGGHITFTSGNLSGQSYPIRKFHASDRIYLQYPTRRAFALEDRFTAYAGCDKRMSTCDGVWSNSDNFGGFQTMPGTATVITTGDNIPTATS